MRRYFALITLLILVVGIVGRGCLFRPMTSYPGSYFKQGVNAAWLDVVWVMEQHTPEEIAALANDLDRRQVRTLFVFVSYLKPHGQFNPTYTYAKEFTQTLKTASPKLEVQAWIGLPVSQEDQSPDIGHVELDDPEVRQKIVAFCAEMVTQGGFDGVHLDPEPVRNGDESLLALLDEIRTAIGADPKLSVATRRIWPLFPEQLAMLTDSIAWSASYYREVAQHTDQLAVMTYDSFLPLPELY